MAVALELDSPVLPSSLLVSLLASLLALPDRVPAQDWNGFRGPSGQGIGIADDLPAVFTKEHQRFRVKIGGTGHSSPVVFRGRLYLTRDGAKKGARDVVCFDAKSGEQVWARTCEFEPYRQHQLNSFASSTPTVDATGIYVLWSSGKRLIALALDLEGKPRWERVLGAYDTNHGSGSSPILCDDLMIVANDNEGDESFLMALDKQTGEIRWRRDRRSEPQRGAFSSPILYRPAAAAGKPWVLFTSTAHGLTAVEPETGAVAWELELGFRQRFVNTPCVAGDIVFLSTGSGGGGKEGALVRLPAGAKADKDTDKKKALVEHRLRRSLPYVPCVIAIDGRFYTFADGGVMSCVRARDGEVLWRERLDGSFFSSPVSNGKVIYVVDRAGVLYSLAPKESFELLGKFDLDSPVFATPAIADGLLYVRTADRLVCLGAAEKKKSTTKPDRK